MPLLDHFHPPLSSVRHWESFHARWASAIADALNNDLLPEDYYAEEQVHVGSRVEVDVATFEERSAGPGGAGKSAAATLPARVWTPPQARMVMPAIFPDSLEVLVVNKEAGPTLVAAVELVSPGNKDREDYRRAFAAKCAAYLQQGIGLMVIDIVTNRQANLHNELVQLLNTGGQCLLPADLLYATAYHPLRRLDLEQIEIWTEELAVGRSLPLLPLPLDKGQFIPLDLEGTYAEACRTRRLP